MVELTASSSRSMLPRPAPAGDPLHCCVALQAHLPVIVVANKVDFVPTRAIERGRLGDDRLL